MVIKHDNTSSVPSEDEPCTLEIGCGENPNLNYSVHMDCRELPHVEIVANWQDAELPEAMFDKIFANQVFEHLYKNEQIKALRNSWKWLKPGGVLELWTPCLDRLAQLALEGSITFEWLQEVLYGEQDYTENCHRWVHCKSTLRTMVLLCNFIIVELVEIDGSLKLVCVKPG